MRIQLLFIRLADILTHHVRKSAGLAIGQRGDWIVFADLANQSDDLSPGQRLNVGLRRAISATCHSIAAKTHVRDAQQMGVEAVHLE